MAPVDQVIERMLEGHRRGYGMSGSVLSHSLQCGMQAERQGAATPLIVAALLHDIGHMINPDARGAAERGEDAEHEIRAERYLKRWFDPPVTAPIRLHVAAKRYLTAVEPEYMAKLSSGSKYTLQLQGGPFTADQAAMFIAQPYAQDAVALRRWDEAAKNPNISPPDLEHFRPYLAAVLRPAAA